MQSKKKVGVGKKKIKKSNSILGSVSKNKKKVCKFWTKKISKNKRKNKSV
jgi:hypothetical protein